MVSWHFAALHWYCTAHTAQHTLGCTGLRCSALEVKSGGAEVGPRLFCRGFTVSFQCRTAVYRGGSPFAGTQCTCFVFFLSF
jgi:hypothetical protein